MSFILCPECSACLGEIVNLYKKARDGLTKSVIDDNYADYDIHKIAFKDGELSTGFILDVLGATKICCRQHLMGMVDNEVLII